jgi:hypothetical protein
LKVDVVKRWCVRRRRQTRLIAIPRRIQDLTPRRVALTCDLLLCAANTYAARRTVARLAATNGIPAVGAGVEDGSVRRAGVVTVWQPSKRQMACQACLLTDSSRSASVGSLVPTVVALTSALAADLVRVILCGNDVFYNFVEVDADQLTMTTINIRRRRSCTSCSMPPVR